MMQLGQRSLFPTWCREVRERKRFGAGLVSAVTVLTCTRLCELSAVGVLVAACTVVTSGVREVSMPEVISIARTEAMRLGYDVGTMDIDADPGNSRWSRWIQNPEISAEVRRMQPDLMRRLAVTPYWAVYLALRTPPGFARGGGALFVFVDKQTGSVIGALDQP